MSSEEIAAIVEQLQPAVDKQDRDRCKHEYGVLTVEEMAARMKCTPEAVLEQEVAGDLFAALAPGRTGGPLYPKFQLDDRLNRCLLKQIIEEYRDAGFSTTLLWSFLRSPQSIFAAFTPMAMMLRALPRAFAPLKPEEWPDAFLACGDIWAFEAVRFHLRSAVACVEFVLQTAQAGTSRC